MALIGKETVDSLFTVLKPKEKGGEKDMELIGEEGDDDVEEIVEEEISKIPETDKDDEAEDMNEDEEEDTSDDDDDDDDDDEELEIDEQLRGDLKAALGDAAVKEDNDSDLEDLDMDT